MHSYTLRRKSLLGSSVKFFGKWPFIRILGLEEFLSSLGSIFNLFPHLYHLLYKRSDYAGNVVMRLPLIIYSSIASVSWVASAAFHGRETLVTERSDYFLATLQVLYTTWLAGYRIWGPPSGGENNNKAWWTSWFSGALSVLGFVVYVAYMVKVKFDYGLHMRLNATLVILHFLSWFHWAFLGAGRTRSYKWRAVAFVVLINLAAVCEVWDFPPVWGIMDAHSAWHLMTAPMIPIWYGFWIEDCKWEGRKIGKRIEGG
ncbi:hypothetical protein TrCOL_g4869 [Triparma columacea]|uniref:Post-GPI attachment to proteins factor 3 n=1 Tax=Triparma columacea TaxID=722753 RepID=A0A9W7GND1_9STRA|nr:hypothetical protein TrCOL_g4869 [Triparma columacea]